MATKEKKMMSAVVLELSSGGNKILPCLRTL
jgi:hypothetical protein